jgi:hypothetical protein
MPAGYKAIITIEQEQILLSAMSISGGTITCTIDTRGYNGTTAATHAAGTLIEVHLTKAHLDQLQNYIAEFDDGGFIVQTTVTTVVSATSHTIANDQTAIFTVGRVYLFKVAGTWYRALITAVSFGAGTTTITLLGDGLPGSGTVTNAAFEFNQSVNKAVDIELIKQVTNAPSVNPPSGYLFLWAKNGGWYTRDSSGNVRFLNIITAAVSSSGGVLTCDCSTANFFECTLTENITQVTWSNGTDGDAYHLRIRQHASAAKTVALNTAGGTRFMNDYATYVATADLSAVDYLVFRYHGGDSKWDLVQVSKGAQSSPTQNSILSYPMYGDGSDGASTISTNTTLNPSYKIFQYSTLNIQVGNTLGFGANFQNKFVIIKVKGDCTIAGTLSVNGLGGTGGAHGSKSGGGSPSSGSGGSNGNPGIQIFDNTVGNAGGGGSDGGFSNGKGGGGGGGGGYVGTASAGSAGSGSNGSSSGGSAGTGRGVLWAVALSQRRGGFFVACGNGGGGGGGGSGSTGAGGDGGDGGAGGGCLILLVGGTLTFTGSITGNGANGANGGNATSGNCSGGGGGGGGSGGGVVALYKTGGTLSGTISTNAGSGGSGGSGAGTGGAGGSGGSGSAGESVIEQDLGLVG